MNFINYHNPGTGMEPEGPNAENEKKPTIEVQKDGPYLVHLLKNFRNSKGVFIETQPYMALCRCGKSSSMPFCDGTHLNVGFKGDKREGRVPDRLDTYDGKQITIHDNRGVCSHIGHCTGNVPKVFRRDAEPWIDPDGDNPEYTARIIRMCPSGALSFTSEGKLRKEWGHEPEIFIGPNRSYHVAGNIQLHDPDGNKPETSDHYCLCRCGKSSNKPFCDGTHWYVKFEDEKN